jgi:hypothetical protein
MHGCRDDDDSGGGTMTNDLFWPILDARNGSVSEEDRNYYSPFCWRSLLHHLFNPSFLLLIITRTANEFTYHAQASTDKEKKVIPPRFFFKKIFFLLT